MSILIPSADAVKTVPDIIRAASSSPLGILALIIPVLGRLAHAYFKNAPVNVRVGIFSTLFLGAVLTQSPSQRSFSLASPHILDMKLHLRI
jgi:hypothetical protein